MVLKLVLTTFMLNSCLECFVLSSHVPLFDSSSLLVAKLYSEIKPDDSRVKGTKKGKAKKKKSTVDPFEKKKPKLDELKVQSRQTKLNVFHQFSLQVAAAGHFSTFFLFHFYTFCLSHLFRCFLRSWRLNLTTLKTGCTVLICSEERLVMMKTKTPQMKTGLLANSK